MFIRKDRQNSSLPDSHYLRRFQSQIQLLLNRFKLTDHALLLFVSLASIQQLIFVLQQQSVHFFQKFSDRGFILYLLLHFPAVDLQQLLVPAV